jgi:ribonuclease BN (tRNA processing enzyme)
MRLTVVGCSGSFPSPASPASCYLVEADDDTGRTWRVALDFGNGAIGPLQSYTRLVELDAVVLSHLHPDHCLDLTGLYVAFRYAPDGVPARRLPVWGPPGTLDRLEGAYGEHESGSLALVYQVGTLVEGVPVTVGPFSITPRRVEHPIEAYALRVEAGGAVLAYSGDSDACPGLTESARDADLLLAEASFVEGRDLTRGIHLTGRRAGETAAEAGASRLMLTHLPVWTDPAVVAAEARAVYAGPVEVARAGLQVTLRATRPAASPG